jgi:hypothetical protein
MSRKNKKTNQQTPNAGPRIHGEKPPAMEVQRIRELIAGRHSKAAVGLAKDLHKRSGTAETEALLLDAYHCRIEDLLSLGMAVEAGSLLQMVEEQYPSSRSRTVDLQREVAAKSGRLDEIVAPLEDANLAPEVRERIETFVRQRVHDLPALAAVSSLRPDHPLREGAAALAAAFKAVTRGPVDDGDIALPQVSRRSPLAPWKALIRAIAEFYRREDEGCKRWLQSVPQDSAPARLVRPLMGMLGTSAAPEFSAAEQRLMSAAGDGTASLRAALLTLEEALARKKRKMVLKEAQTVVAICNQCSSVIRERVRQHIVVRLLAFGITRNETCTAIGGAPREDAYFWRLLARSAEQHAGVENLGSAILYWEEFRREAIREKWFVAGGMEDGVLALHMAQLAERLPHDLFEDFGFRRSSRRDQSDGELIDDDLFSPEKLYERACQADPHPDAFQRWLNWTDKRQTWKDADLVAELWRRIRPEDIKPLLYLMESAEKRGAYQKSLKHLAEAEELDRLNPEVRRAKLRLLFSAAIHKLKQRKTRLVMLEIARMEALPAVREGEIAALASALRFLCAGLEKDMAEMQRQREQLEVLLGNLIPGHVLTNGLAKAAKLDGMVELPPLDVSAVPAVDLLSGVIRADTLGDGVGLPLSLPWDWEQHLIAALDQFDRPTNITQMLVLGEAALRSKLFKLAYAVSSLGLANGAADARFLFLRARGLPFGHQRQAGCLSAALELARRDRNMDLAGKILDQIRSNEGPDWGLGFLDDLDPGKRQMDPDLLSQILEEERAEKKFPVFGQNRAPKYGPKLEGSRSNCPESRTQRSEPVEDWDEDDEEDWGFPAEPKELNQFAEFLENLPPEIAQEIEESIIRGESPEVAAHRIFGNLPPEILGSSVKNTKPKKQTRKLPSPDQGDLFLE